MRRITAEMSQWRLQKCTGKNLMPPIPVTTLTTGGVTMRLDADGVITLSGTATRQIYQDFELPFPFRYPAGARTHVRNNAVGNGGNVVLAWLNTAATQVASVTQNVINKIGFAASADMDIGFIRVTVSNGVSLYNYQMRPSVEMSNETTDYEPYCGGSPNRIEVDNCKGGYFSVLPDYGLRVEGATLQDGTPTPDNPVPIQCVKAGTKVRAGSPMTTTTAWINTNNQLAFSPDSFSARFEVRPSTQYELYLDTDVSSLFRAGVTSSEALPVLGAPIALSSVVRSNTPSHITLNTAASSKYIWVQISAGQRQAIYSLTVIDKSNGTTYKPFVVSEITVPCDLYEGDVWYPMTGRVEHNTYVGMLSSVWTWGDWPNGRLYRGVNSMSNYPYPHVGKRLCTHLAYGGSLQIPHFSLSNSSHTTENQCIYLNLPGILSEEMTIEQKREAFNAFLDREASKGTPVMVSWRRAEPLIEHYDPQPIFAPQGTVIVTQSPTELAANLSATMLVRR